MEEKVGLFGGGVKLLLSPRGLLTQTLSQPRDLHSHFETCLNSVEPRGFESNNYFIRASVKLQAQRKHFCSVYCSVRFRHMPFHASKLAFLQMVKEVFSDKLENGKGEVNLKEEKVITQIVRRSVQ